MRVFPVASSRRLEASPDSWRVGLVVGLERAEGIDQATLREASLERLADTCQPLLRALQLLTP